MARGGDWRGLWLPHPFAASREASAGSPGGSVRRSLGRSGGHGRSAHLPAVAPPLGPRARRAAGAAAVGRRRGRGGGAEAVAAGAGLGGGGGGSGRLRGVPAVRAAAGALPGAGGRRAGRGPGAAPHPRGGRCQGDGRCVRAAPLPPHGPPASRLRAALGGAARRAGGPAGRCQLPGEPAGAGGDGGTSLPAPPLWKRLRREAAGGGGAAPRAVAQR